MESEDQIIASVIAGKTGEFRKLVEQYQLPIYRFARSLIRDEHDAEDITQEVFLSAFDHLESYKLKRASLLAWPLSLQVVHTSVP